MNNQAAGWHEPETEEYTIPYRQEIQPDVELL